ncbi:MAG TPA: IS110 family transposase [Pyrinomonadaceae bacterium]|nr:IS110 family transposase [Pyrinomonadaceae bacterium]
MQVKYARCAALDVHKNTVVGCVMISGSTGGVEQELRTFATYTADLLTLSDWLKSHGVTHVAMESTGVYWKPVYNLLEGLFELLVVNARHVKAVPGRKTDVKDAEWLADLLRHGLLRGSYIPARPQRQLRELTRHRSNLVQRRAQAVNELQKCLESANIKLASVATDVTGVSATEMLGGLLAGQAQPELLAELARGRLKEKKPLLQKALHGRVEAHHRLILSQLLAEIAWCEEQVSEVSLEIAQRLKEQEELLNRLDEIPGVNQRIAQVAIAEMGSDMKPFPSDKHLCSWAGLCPGNNESAGKRRSSRICPGNRHLKVALMEAANAASRKKGCYLRAKYHRLSGRRGRKRALVAVARTILQSMYYMVQRGTPYQDLGENYYDQRNPQKLANRLAKRIEKLGFKVVIEGVPQAA